MTPSPDTPEAKETLEQIAARIARRAVGRNPNCATRRQLCADAILSALRNEREACAKVADRWATARSCNTHDDNPCCHVRTGARIAEVIREGK